MGSLPESVLQPSLFYFLLLLVLAGVAAKVDDGFDVGLILERGSTVGRIALTAVNMSLSDFYEKHPHSTPRLRIHLKDSADGDVVGAASAALDLIQNERVKVIIGPQTSVEAVFLAELGTQIHVPVVSFMATSPSVSPKEKPYFVRAAPNDGSQAKPIAAFVRSFGWRRVVVVYEDTDYGSGPLPYLFDALKQVEARVIYRLVLPPSASDDRIQKELYELNTMQTRVIVAHMGTSFASRFFPLVKKAQMMSPSYAWIVTAGLAGLLDIVDAAVIDSMQGVIAVKPYIAESQVLEDFKKRWKRKFRLENPEIEVSDPTTVGVRAYDTIWAVATAAETLGNETALTDVPEAVDLSTDMAALGSSAAGPKVLKSILQTKFDGLSGTFRLIDGELGVQAYEIVNFHGRSQRSVGFWTPSGGLKRDLDENGRKNPSNSTENLRSIIWPGESHLVPKGWNDPIGEKKMKVGVPADSGFDSILKVDTDPLTNTTIPSGFVIDVFQEALKGLPYAVPLEYKIYNGSYDSLVNQIALQTFDAVVGDVTITYERSLLVDFTLPFTRRGVAMVVPLEDQRENNGRIFLEPMALELWLVAGAFFFFTGAVVWVLEHRINATFRGSPSIQIGSAFYFTFSTLVFAHREKIVSNLSRVVVIVWLFVVLVLTSSYTASLVSIFTVQRLQPKYSDIDEIRKNGESVGYIGTSFVGKTLKDLNFNENQLKPCKSLDDYAKALADGSKNGVSVIVDEIPYLQVFLKDHCSSYTMTNAFHHTEGFGFAFPKGSPLVVDISRSILNMTGGNKMVEIEKRWFGEDKSCPSKERDVSVKVLDFKSFWWPFFFTGLVSAASLFFSILHRNWRKLVAMFWEEGDRLQSTASRSEDESESSFSISNHSYFLGDLSPDLVSTPRFGSSHYVVPQTEN